ncbi:hypothetical protein [Micrococcus luteus]|uniref:hypothetical protein n=1 Tax=Micrococcus luteus TaxID=1270 RepID=UPI0020120AD4|nr:hypothetical protein [Micrococcus luteus]
MPRPVAVAPEDLPLRLMPAAPARRDHCVVLLHGFTSTPASVRAWAEGSRQAAPP